MVRLSLFDGSSTGQYVTNSNDKYYASEIDEVAISITQYNFPNTIQLGDITKIDETVLKGLDKIDIVMFGSPYQSFSKSGTQTGFDGKSGLFYEAFRILKWIKEHNNPNVNFLMENVHMKKE